LRAPSEYCASNASNPRKEDSTHMPGATILASTTIISRDGKHKIVVTYTPDMSKADRRALRKAARRKLSYMTDESWRARRHRRSKSHYRTSNIFTRHRTTELPSRNPNPGNGVVWKCGVRRDFQNFKLFQTLPVTNGETRTLSRYGRECWDQVNPGPPYRTGGPFRLIEYQVPGTEFKKGYAGTGNIPASGNYSTYEGGYLDDGFWIADSFGPYSQASLASFPSLSAYHSQAWDSTKPTVPAWNASQFIYELRDLPGMLEQTANFFHNAWRSFGGGYSTTFMAPRNVADSFVNEQFGWAPFIGDLQKLLKAWEDSSNFISRTVRDNRRWVKKRRVLETTEEVSPLQRFYSSGTIPNSGVLDWFNVPMCRSYSLDGNLIRGHCDFQKIVKKTVWAVGSFMFYRPEFDANDPDFDSGLMTLRRALTQYGARINPSVVYKLIPWTWCVDWFTGFGRYIDRINDFVEDGITARYLYVCRTEERTMTKTSFLNYFNNPHTVQFQRRLLLKQREVADSPYGFNVPWNSISLRQASILAAIGISRSGAGYVSRGA